MFVCSCRLPAKDSHHHLIGAYILETKHPPSPREAYDFSLQRQPPTMTTDKAKTSTVQVVEPTKMALVSSEKVVPKGPLRFMHLSVDIKSLIVSHVGSACLTSCTTCPHCGASQANHLTGPSANRTQKPLPHLLSDAPHHRPETIP